MDIGMAGVSFTVTAEGFEDVIDFLNLLTPRQANELATMAGVELVKISRQAFQDATDPVDGSKWRPSGRSTTLRDTGRLARSVKSRVTGRGEVAVGSHLEYARIHQEGGQAGPKNRRVSIPRRRYLGHDKKWTDRFMDTPEVRRLFV